MLLLDKVPEHPLVPKFCAESESGLQISKFETACFRFPSLSIFFLLMGLIFKKCCHPDDGDRGTNFGECSAPLMICAYSEVRACVDSQRPQILELAKLGPPSRRPAIINPPSLHAVSFVFYAPSTISKAIAHAMQMRWFLTFCRLPNTIYLGGAHTRLMKVRNNDAPDC